MCSSLGGVRNAGGRLLHSHGGLAAQRPMAEAHRRLMAALKAGASVADIQRLLVGAKQETAAEVADGREVVRAAFDRDADVLQVVLDAMGRKVILAGDPAFGCNERSTLYYALERGRKDTVLAVVERMKKESAYEMSTWVLYALFDSQLFLDEEVVEAVLGVVPAATFAPAQYGDSLERAFCCKHEHRERAVDLCIRLGPSMEERLEGKKRFCFVDMAARQCDVKMVQKMHDMVPLLPDGSGRRGTDQDYVRAFHWATRCRGSAVSKAASMEYLVEQGGSHILDQCDPLILLKFRKVEDIEWLLGRAPHLLEEACKKMTSLKSLICRRNTVDYLTEQMVELVEPSVIVDLMRDCGIPAWERRGTNWRMRLKRLHEGVPECMDGLRWPWLMEAIEDKVYGDVEYMVTMCTREHLVKRNQNGDRAYDVAARDERFPPHLLGRLKLATKGAHD